MVTSRLGIVVLLLVAAINLLTAVITYKTNQTVNAAAANIGLIHTATNSMHDALVKAAYKEGGQDEKAKTGP